MPFKDAPLSPVSHRYWQLFEITKSVSRDQLKSMVPKCAAHMSRWKLSCCRTLMMNFPLFLAVWCKSISCKHLNIHTLYEFGRGFTVDEKQPREGDEKKDCRGMYWLENRSVWREDWNEEACLNSKRRLVPGRWALVWQVTCPWFLWWHFVSLLVCVLQGWQQCLLLQHNCSGYCACVSVQPQWEWLMYTAVHCFQSVFVG